MVDLNDDFRLLIRKSCERGLKDCHSLASLPQLTPLLADQTAYERTRIIRAFLLCSLNYAVEKAVMEEERNIIRAAAAFIGLEPQSGGTQEFRAGVAAEISETKNSARTMRSEVFSATVTPAFAA